ncbi:MAG: zinc-dependent metalloprotease [Bacteroidetes bacterium]|nr:zinc-dependent metalloprotease [Bacteroidota bacterium]
MLRFLYVRCITVFLIVSIPMFSFADGVHILSDMVTKAHIKGIQFQPLHLFNKTTGEKHTNLMKAETLLIPATDEISNLYNNRPVAVSLNVVTDAGVQYRLEMLQYSPFAENAQYQYIDKTGKHNCSFDRGVHYEGAVAGLEQSLATMSVFANGDVMILFATAEGDFVLGKIEDGSGKYILYNDNDVFNKPYMPCGVSVSDYKTNSLNYGQQKTTAVTQCHNIKLYWETDYQLYQAKGDLTKTQNYMTGLFGQVQAVYRNENIYLSLQKLACWTAPDGYIDTSSAGALPDFKSKWNAMSNNFDGDLAHLITMDGKSNGGRAYLDVLCDKATGYAYSEIDGSFSKLPAYSWDVEVISHETGHNVGSHHTHWCGWNTGAGGTCGSIDSCVQVEAGGVGGCSSCTHLFNNNSTAWQGTIMSYCHLSSRGISLANGFGQAPGDLIRSKANTASCLASMPVDSCIPVTAIRPVYSNSGNVSLYPNPANTAFTLLYDVVNAGEIEIKVTDMLGKVVYIQMAYSRVGNNKLDIYINNWAKGVYFVSVGTESAKLVVQ